MRRSSLSGLAAVLLCCGRCEARDDKCIAAMQDRVQACVASCVEKARAAVDPSVKDLVIGRACGKNCLKIEMFHGQACP